MMTSQADRLALATIHVPVLTHKVVGDDPFQSLLRQVHADYIRLTDAQTVHFHAVATESDDQDQARFARDMLARNAAPIALEIAFDYSTRFGGLIEAYDAALHLLFKLLPAVRETADGKCRKVGWNPHRNGVRWLTWVRLKVISEMPTAAERLVDEKRQSGAGAAIAAARERLLYGLANDGALFLTDEPQLPSKVRPGKQLPRGRKNLIVKRGSARYTPASLARTVDLFAGQTFKPTLCLAGPRLGTLPGTGSGSPIQVHNGLLVGLRISTLRLDAPNVARAVRATARSLLDRNAAQVRCGGKPMGDRTLATAAHLARVAPEWVNRNARSLKLDALVGDDQDERLVDIIAGEEPEQRRFEAPLHPADLRLALAAHRRYGPVHGDALVRLPVRELLPVYRRVERQRAVQARFQALLDRCHVKHPGLAISAAYLAAQLCGLDQDAPLSTLRDDLAGVQAAFRTPTAARPTLLGTALSAALHGTSLQVATQDDRRVADQLKLVFPELRFGFPLAAMIGFARKLRRFEPKPGKPSDDEKLRAAAFKAQLPAWQVESALKAVMADLALTSVVHRPARATGALGSAQPRRVRVRGPKGYVRPYQLALEQDALRIGRYADEANHLTQKLERTITAAAQHVHEQAVHARREHTRRIQNAERSLRVWEHVMTTTPDGDVFFNALTHVDNAKAELNALRSPQEHASMQAQHQIDQLNLQLSRAQHATTLLSEAARTLEQSCTDLNLARALDALITADAVLDDLSALTQPDTWWAHAHWALA